MEIHIYNAHSQIHTTNQKVFDACRKTLSYIVDGANFVQANLGYAWDGRTYLMNHKGEFPSGLLGTLVAELKKLKVEYKLIDCRRMPPKRYNFVLNAFEPRPYQSACVELSDRRNRGVYVCGTGGGKSLISAMIIQKKGLNTLMIVPDTSLRTQLTNDYQKWFGKKMVSNKLGGAPIVVANIQALAKLKPEAFKNVECLMIDEFHMSAAKSYKKVNKNCVNAYYRYGYTGTFLRSAGDTMEMYGVLSNIIFKITTSELIKQGYLMKPEITIVKYDLPKMRCRYTEAYDYLISDGDLHRLIARMAQRSIDEKKQTLIVVRRKEHGKALAELLTDAVYLDGDSPSDYREENKAAFINRKISCIISTNIFGQGIDIPTIDVYYNARFEKTEIWTTQGIGRVLRKAPGKSKAEVYDFFITGHKALESHSKARLNSYSKEEEFSIQQVSQSDLDL